MEHCKSCADCSAINCHTMAGEFPEYCVTVNMKADQYKEAMACYDDPETHALAIAAGEVEYEGKVIEQNPKAHLQVVFGTKAMTSKVKPVFEMTVPPGRPEASCCAVRLLRCSRPPPARPAARSHCFHRYHRHCSQRPSRGR